MRSILFSISIFLIILGLNSCKVKKSFIQKIIFSEQTTLVHEKQVQIKNNISVDTSFFGIVRKVGNYKLLNTFSYSDSEIILTKYNIGFDDTKIKEEENSVVVDKWLKAKGVVLQSKKRYVKADFIFSNQEVQIFDFSEKIKKAKKKTEKWLQKNRKQIDLNKFKNTKRYLSALKRDVGNLNFNNTSFERNYNVTFIDADKKIIGINAGKNTLYKDEQKAHYLSYHFIYNYKKNELEKLIIHNTGYFLE